MRTRTGVATAAVIIVGAVMGGFGPLRPLAQAQTSTIDFVVPLWVRRGNGLETTS